MGRSHLILASVTGSGVNVDPARALVDGALDRLQGAKLDKVW